jgi:hypothetical protein
VRESVCERERESLRARACVRACVGWVVLSAILGNITGYHFPEILLVMSSDCSECLQVIQNEILAMFLNYMYDMRMNHAEQNQEDGNDWV